RDRLPALAVLNLDLAGAKLELRLLGASHQVLPGSWSGKFRPAGPVWRDARDARD
ncbi:DUF2617 family protein, partial [Streptomyces sp. NPDC059456]|uniref:DUF2617 family protein n=1 Tax=Streptomyces sp. NPDC059456 TaxID=3346838 RepID=UPI0036D172B3